MLRRALADACGLAAELVIVNTSGDRIQDRPLADAGGKGLFTKELEAALLAREIDLAVHSMKDVPVVLPEGLEIVAVPPREDPRDVFISPRARTIEDLPPGARVGTSSVRRAAQLRRARRDLEIVPLRGNVDTRLRKLDGGEIDAIILALAGLRRLGLAERVTSILDTARWLPALSQGAIGVQMRTGDDAASAIRTKLNDSATEIALACERAFQEELDGTCRTSIAGLARVEDGDLRFAGEVLAPDGSDCASACLEVGLEGDCIAEAHEAGRAAARSIKLRARPWLAV